MKQSPCVFLCVVSLLKGGYAFFIFEGYDMKRVTFCGHRSLAGVDLARLKKLLRFVIEEAILNGAVEFMLGGYGEFDVLCAVTVREFKDKYPQIKSILVVPYIDKEYNEELYDCSEYPSIENVPKRYAISKRNEYMVDSSDLVIVFIRCNFGGAYTTFEYAKRRKKEIINLYNF